ncbi:MAG: hypothetical protein K0S28_2414 [Paucimonas sp.]|jgi:hypothetical protein|nr:hypothetical protein [Paucimonas sp.]
MNTRDMKRFTALSCFAILAACGGQSTDQGGNKFLPTMTTVEGRVYNSCSESPECSGNPSAPFAASVSAAPPAGAVLNGVVRLEVNGLEMGNVELLPATGYTPRVATFNISADKAFAWLDLDTRNLPNGALTVRVSAFSKPAGQSGAVEKVAMPARTWTINNPQPLTGGFTATASVAPANNAIVRGTTRLEVRGNRLANVELLPATGYSPRLGVFNVSADRTVAWLDFDTRSLPDGIRDVRISAFSAFPGQPNATELVAMQARRWDFRNGSTTAFTGALTVAPLNGEIISGKISLGIRGSGIANAELLPASGYTPRYGTFGFGLTGAADQYGYLELDTTTLPNGPFTARISAFSVAAGQPNGKEIILMPARQWIIRN